jgi:hypothetical protein
MLGAWNLSAPGAVRAVDPSPSPAETVPPVSPAPVPGVDCALYSLIGSDLPPCPSPTPRPSPYVLYPSATPTPSGPPVFDPVCYASMSHNADAEGGWYGQGCSPSLGSIIVAESPTGPDRRVVVVTVTYDVSSADGGAGAMVAGTQPIGSTLYDHRPERTSSGQHTVTVSIDTGYLTAGTHPVWVMAFQASSGAGSTTTILAASMVDPNVVASPSPSAPPAVVWPIPGVNCLTYPLAGSDLPSCSSGQFWQDGVNCVLFPLPQGLPNSSLPVCPAHPLVPGVDCAIYPLVGGEMGPCPTAMPSPGDCVMYGLTGSDAPVCPDGFAAVPWRHEWPISGTSCPVVKWGFQAYDRTPICAFPGLTLNLGDYMSWLGCMVGVILTTLVNAIRWGINSLIDMLSPCPPMIAATLARFGDSFQQGPFAMVAGTVHALQSGVSGGPGIPFGSFTLYGRTYSLPLMELAHAAAPIRPYLMPIVAFGVAIRALGMFATAVKGPGPTGDEGGGKK